MGLVESAAMTPLTDRQGRFSIFKTATLILALLPAAVIAYWFITHQLGPLPIKAALRLIGDWTIRLLVITLALTPLQRVLNWPKIALVRRMLGVTTFSYALTHFTLYIVQSKFDLAFVASEIILRFYLTIGFVALIGLSLLAATSFDSAIRKLGKKWKLIHRLVYGIAVLGLLHYFIQSKIDVSPATLMAGFFLLLMVYRVFINRRVNLTPLVLAISAGLAGLLTAIVEFAWYALATGVDPWRIAKANLMLSYGLRPAVIVVLVGLIPCGFLIFRNLQGKGWFHLQKQAA
jgi:sulfoxide reductase heme-binding subunit YedZ